MAEKSEEELLAEQKANCIFCQIVDGKIPSKKVYEDDKVIAILDINPAAKGHVLMMTKEHYPIMPVIPPEEFKELFLKAKMITRAVREGMLCESTTIFIANGGVAGQQSPHFLFHIIPREKGDGLDVLEVPENNKDQSDLFPSMKHNMVLLMKNYLKREGKLKLLDLDLDDNKKNNKVVDDKAKAGNGEEKKRPLMTAVNEPEVVLSDNSAKGPVAKAGGAVSGQGADFVKAKNSKGESVTVFNGDKIDQLAKMIDENPEIKALLINNPEKLKAILEANPSLKALFVGIDIDALADAIRKQYFEEQRRAGAFGGGEEGAPVAGPEEAVASPEEEVAESVEEPVNNSGSSGSGSEPVPSAKSMSDEELARYIDEKEALKEYLLTDIDSLKEGISKSDRLRTFFEGTSPEEVLERYLRVKNKETKKSEENKETRENKDGDDDAINESVNSGGSLEDLANG